MLKTNKMGDKADADLNVGHEELSCDENMHGINYR